MSRFSFGSRDAFRGVCLLAVLISPVASYAAEEPAKKEEPTKQGLDFFETKIRPILVEHCYACHSAKAVAAGKLRGALQLDTRDAARTGGESGPAVVPGKPHESLLISALKQEDFKMPPKGKLPDDVIANFVKWVEMGAPDPRDGTAAKAGRVIDIEAGKGFWSFLPLTKSEPPQDDTGWSRTIVDRYIVSRQKEAGLRPNPTAEPRLLVRRAWFDLLGLPPTPEEMQIWVARLTAPADNAGATARFAGVSRLNEEAWGQLIDHLLASPHYGERWARHWIDVARFAESHGYEQDYDRPFAWHYRDFLIRAFNEDMPYNQFVRWQLAGDELAPDNPQAWMATGFLGGGVFPTQLTETEFESARYDELDDMVATTGVAFLGVTTGCARCHDHKFDPIPTADYYRMAASFTTAIRTEKEFDLQPEENRNRKLNYETRLAELRAELEKFERETVAGELRTWLAQYDPASKPAPIWEYLSGTVTSTGSSKFVRQNDGSYLATGATPDKEVVTFQATTERKGIVSLRLEALAHESLPNKGPGRAPNGNFALGDFRVTVLGKAPDAAGAGQAGDANRPTQPIKLVSAAATHQQDTSTLSVAASIDGDPISGWAIDGQVGRDQAAVFKTEKPFELAAGEKLSIVLTFNHPNRKHSIGRLRFSVSSSPEATPTIGNTEPDAKVVDALVRAKQNPDPNSTEWKTALDWFKTTLPTWQQKQKQLVDHETTGMNPVLTKVMVTSEGWPHLSHNADGRGFPHFYPETHILRRGDVNQKEQLATQSFLQVLMRGDKNEAHWKLTPPTGETRASFRRATLSNWITDPEAGAGQLAARVMVNRLWQHHFGRGLVSSPNDFGASGERPSNPQLLDALAADLISGGWRLKRVHKLLMTSSVYMQSSAFDEPRAKLDRENTLLWRRTPHRLEAEAIRDSMLSVAGQLDTTMYGAGTLDQGMRRRSVYFFIKRSQLIPMMMLFDWPEHLVSIGQRSSTTIAPQSLMFMNSPQGRQAAEAFAARLDGMEPAAAVETAYRLAYGRVPEDRERQLSAAFVERQRGRYQGAAAESTRRALADLCQTLMSMNEFIYVD